MIRILFILAIAYGIFWSGTNFDFSAFKAKSIETFKNEKTVNIVNTSFSFLFIVTFYSPINNLCLL